MHSNFKANPELWKRWKVIEYHLNDSLQYIDVACYNEDELAKLLQKYNDYIVHNEFELAMDELAELSEVHICRGMFWKCLMVAAQNMELKVKFNILLQNLTQYKLG